MPQKLSAGVVSLVVLAIIIALVVGGGIVLLRKNIPLPLGGPTATPGGETNPDNTVPADWPVFKNETYKYQINYPPNFHVQGKNEPPYPPPPVTQSFSFRYDNGEHCDFEILASSNIEGFRGEIAGIREQGRDTESIQTLVGVPVIVFDAQGGNAISRSFYIDQNNPRLRMGYNYEPAAKYSQECGDTVAKMVASFKLLE